MSLRWRGRKRRGSATGRLFAIAHDAERGDLYELRLEIDGVLACWAISSGPSTNPRDRRMARRIEDRPVDDGGDIRERGTYTNATEREMSEGLARGHLSFWLQGENLSGGFTLTRIRDGKDETWLLMRRNDGPDPRRTPARPESVLTGGTLDRPDDA
jgi:DNA ligase D-like protein (predicted 3'-phosphoesterase)